MSVAPANLRQIDWYDELGEIHLFTEPSPEGRHRRWVLTRRAGQQAQTWPSTAHADVLVSQLAALRAARSLGRPDADHLHAFGLDAPQKKLQLHAAGAQQILSIGNATFGGAAWYGRTAAGEVYLLASQSLRGLQHGGLSLVDRRALGVTPAALDRLVLHAGSSARELRVRSGDAPTSALVTDLSNPDEALPVATSWLARVVELRVMQLCEQTPAGAPAFALDIYRASTQVGRLAVWPQRDGGHLALSSHHRQAFVISAGGIASVLRDVPQVLDEHP